LFETNALKWDDASIQTGKQYAYRVEALSPDGSCVSIPSACVIAKDPVQAPIIPWIIH
jgi:hypothetical protein